MDENSRRIAKNTAFLYFRMLFLMAISLFTSRVLLHALGVEDFGINSVVGGFVVMFAFINRSMSGVTQRFLTYELGRKNEEKLNKVFNTTLAIHIGLGLLMILFAETFGLWFLYNKMVIPPERFSAALWVFHTCVIIIALGISYVPFNALIISHERMNVFAWISILEGIIKITIAYCIYLTKSDKLIFYSILMLASQILIVFIYIGYSKSHFAETKISVPTNNSIFKEILGFFGWNFYGTMGSVITNQGINVLLNLFFGVVVNAARGIAVQVEGAVLAFAENVQTAINPQITKSYAKEELQTMHRLIFFNCKITFFVMFVLSTPIWIEADTILHLWLGKYPDYTVPFLRLLLIAIMIDVIGKPFVTSINATGKVKLFYMITGSILLLVLPITYFAVKFTQNPCTAFWCMIVMQICIFFCRLFLSKPLIKLNMTQAFYVFVKLLLVSFLCISIILWLKSYLITSSIASLFIVAISGVILTSFLMYFIVLSSSERQSIKNIIFKKLYFNKIISQ